MKKFILTASFIITSVFILITVFSSPSYAAVCCRIGGGTCTETGAACTAQEKACSGTAPDFVIDPACKVNIVPPDQVKITDFGRLFSGAVAFLLLIAFLLSFFYLIL